MQRTIRLAGMVAALVSAAGRALRAQSCEGPTALVLSGGGAKGLAHIGVLRVLDSLGIRPDMIVGTSMGSIVGAMYASGYSGNQIDSLARSLPLSDLFRTYEPRASHLLGERAPLVVWEQGEAGFVLQRAAVREGEVNALLNAGMLRGNLIARGTFDSLPIPLRVLATDLATREEVILRGGDLAQAVRASVSIPLVFEPEKIGGRFLGDGALVANIPVGVARAEGARRVIVSDATQHAADTLHLASPIILAEQLLGFLFYQPLAPLASDDRYVRPDVDKYKSLDFDREKVAALIQTGYQAAESILAADPCRGTAGSAAPPAPIGQMNGFSLDGGRPATERFIRKTLGLTEGDSVDVTRLRQGLRSLADYEEIKAVWLRPSGSADSMVFSALLQPGPVRLAALGLAYDNDLGGRMWLGAADRTLLNQQVEGAASAALGSLRQEVDLAFRLARIGRHPVRPILSAAIAREEVRVFDPEGNQLSSLRTRELYGLIGLERGFGGPWFATVGGFGHLWHEPGRDGSAAGGVLRVTNGGWDRDASVHLEGVATGGYSRLSLAAGTSIGSGRIRALPMVRAGWGRDLPAQARLMLGGEDGFPGLRIGEQRGDREAFVDLGLAYRLIGPLEARLEGAVGQVATGGAALPQGAWEYGGRVGFGATTPVGPILVEYSRARGGRGEMYVRLGHWF